MKAQVAVFLLSLLRRTWRLRIHGVVPERGVVAFWHGHMLPVWALFAGRGAVALVSSSRDGELLAAVLHRWKYRCVRGSSSRGGAHALNDLIEHAKGGRLVLITPDGPRGPRGTVKRGAVVCAQHAGVPLYWCRVHCRWAWRFQRSWDRFLLPLPLARVTIEISPAMHIPAELTDNAVLDYCRSLQQRYAPTD
jgi:hypothetical protein